MFNTIYDEDELPVGYADKALGVGRSATLFHSVTISVWISRLDLLCAIQAQSKLRSTCSWNRNVKNVWDDACSSLKKFSFERASTFVSEFSASTTDTNQLLDRRRLDIAADADDSELRSSMVQLWM
jgi:hypothetical protein